MSPTLRPTIDEMMLSIAKLVAQRSTCSSRLKVGAVLATTDGRILSFGYNGVPRGMPHCDDAGCQRGPDNKHLWLLHAEENAIVNAAANGIAVKGAVAYVTHFPCSHCAAVFAQAGIITVIYEKEYGDTSKAALTVFRQCSIEVVQKEISNE